MQLSALLAFLAAANLALAAPVNTHKRDPSPFFLDLSGLFKDAASGTSDASASINQALADILANISVKRALGSGAGKEGDVAANVAARRDNGDSDAAASLR